jgi:hypothetical protein
MTQRSLLRISLVLVLTLYLAFPAALAQTRTARVIAEKANLRETPSTTGLAEGEVPEGVVVKILDEKLPWFVVRVGDRVGWMHAATLLLMDNATTTSDREPVRVTAPAETYSLPQPTRSTTDKVYVRGPRGGCYYISGSGRKVYVDRSMCN